MANRVSQETVEVLESPNANVRVSQEVVEVLDSPNANVRLSQEAIEVLFRASKFVPQVMPVRRV